MKARRYAFRDKFAHVFEDGATGVSIVQFSSDDIQQAEHLVNTLFRKNLIADVLEYR